MDPAVEWRTAAPAPRLRACIDRYVGYRMTGFPPGLHRGLPSRHMTFIASIGPTIDVVSQTDPRQAPASYGCVLSGLQASLAVISHTGHQEGVAIELTPLGCRTLFGMPSRALWNTSVECADVAGATGRELWERVHGLDSWDARFAACGEVLAARVVRFERAREMLQSTPSFVTVAQVAAVCGYYDQAHLDRDFAELAGCAPTTWLAEELPSFQDGQVGRV